MSDGTHGDENPYQAPQVNPADGSAPPPTVSLFGVIRTLVPMPGYREEAHLAEEATVKAIGLLYYLRGAFSLLNPAGFASSCPMVDCQIIAENPAAKASPEAVRTTIVGGFGDRLGADFLILGQQVRQLRHWARWGIVILSGIGILGGLIGLSMFQGKGLTLDTLDLIVVIVSLLVSG